MAEEIQLLRLVRAFTKIKDQRRRREIVELAEASVEAGNQAEADGIKDVGGLIGFETGLKHS